MSVIVSTSDHGPITHEDATKWHIDHMGTLHILRDSASPSPEIHVATEGPPGHTALASYAKPSWVFVRASQESIEETRVYCERAGGALSHPVHPCCRTEHRYVTPWTPIKESK